MKEKNVDIAQKAKTIIAEQLMVEAKEVKDESNFVNDLGADSLDRVELIMEFEDNFGIEISNEEAEKITTVSEAIAKIQELVQGEKES